MNRKRNLELEISNLINDERFYDDGILDFLLVKHFKKIKHYKKVKKIYKKCEKHDSKEEKLMNKMDSSFKRDSILSKRNVKLQNKSINSIENLGKIIYIKKKPIYYIGSSWKEKNTTALKLYIDNNFKIFITKYIIDVNEHIKENRMLFQTISLKKEKDLKYKGYLDFVWKLN